MRVKEVSAEPNRLLPILQLSLLSPERFTDSFHDTKALCLALVGMRIRGYPSRQNFRLLIIKCLFVFIAGSWMW